MYILQFVKTRVQRWGNSLGLRIPKALAEEAAIANGSMVEVQADEKGRLIVEAVLDASYTLDELLAGVTDENLHHEVRTGGRRGREAW
jgi:antitoxin MazE